MKQIFVGKYIGKFGKFMRLTSILMNKSKERQRRERILLFWSKYGLAAAIEAFNVKRSTLFEWKKKAANNDLEPKSKRPKRLRKPTTPLSTVNEVSKWRTALPFLGKDKIRHLLSKDGIKISASTVGRIIKRNKLPSAPKQHVAKQSRKYRKKRLKHGFEAKRCGEVVGMDTVTIQENGKKKYIITAVDYHSKIAVARTYSSPSSRSAKDLLLRMKIALGREIEDVNTDNGSEFMGKYEKACTELKIGHFHTYPRTPKMNAFAERFNRTIQEEANYPLFEEPIEVWNSYVAHYIILYNFFRPHESLGYETPVEVLLKDYKFYKAEESNMLWTHTKS